MIMSEPRSTYEVFPEDVLERALQWMENGSEVVLARITDVTGGGIRPPGALMAISSSGASSGYLSGGCVDADVVARAQSCVGRSETVQLRYGLGSPFVDLPLPCGGSIGIELIPIRSAVKIFDVVRRLQNRRPGTLALPQDINPEISSEDAGEVLELIPKLKLRIAGRGADCLALAHHARISGYSVHLQLPDSEDIEKSKALGIERIDHLKSVDHLPPEDDDPRTAFVLMFHDRHWEAPLLKQALDGQAFYIGAVGSHRTHERRKPALLGMGCTPDDLERIHAPIGMIPSCRDASALATSILAEILHHEGGDKGANQSAPAALLLAAGQSSRFEDGDKLLAEIDGRPILEHACRVIKGQHTAAKLAVHGPGQSRRVDIAKSEGWAVIENAASAAGQSTSLRLGIQALAANPAVDSVLVLLGDMPFVPSEHIQALKNAMEPGVSAVMTISNGICQPPAMFRRETFDQLMTVSGDRGAATIFKSLENTCTVELSPEFSRDIDTVQDLNERETVNG